MLTRSRESGDAIVPRRVGLSGYGALRRAIYRETLSVILNVEASHLALSKSKHMSDRLVPETVRLTLKRFSLEIVDRLPHLRNDRAIDCPVKAHGLDVRTDHGPLARPIFA
jgi:hypothetical protein